MSSNTVTLVVSSVTGTDFATTGKHYRNATIIMLSDDILLEIFDMCRKNYDPNPRGVLALPDWHILVHVCQRWRQVVFASPLRLNLRILCTHGTPVRKHLDIWPTFPIHLEYTIPPWQIIRSVDEDDIIAALEHPDRLHTVRLSLTHTQLGKVAMAMREPCAALTYLHLSTHMLSSNVPVLPCEFLGKSAPCVQKIELDGIPFPSLPALLLSTSDLVTLRLQNTPQTGYISPQAMVAALATLTRLKELFIEFSSPASRPVSDHMFLPPVTLPVLPALTAFTFWGVREYLEDFMGRINAPSLDSIFICYSNQLVDFEVPRLWQFIDNSEVITGNRPMRCFVEFQHNYVSFGAGTAAHILEYEFFEAIPHYIDFGILCEGIDWQFSHLAQALNQTSSILSNMLHLAIYSDPISPEHEDIDDIEWLQLLRPFSSIKTLFVSRRFAKRVAIALRDSAGMMMAPTEVLPALDILCLEGCRLVPSVHMFLVSRSECGRPVTTVHTRRAFEEILALY